MKNNLINKIIKVENDDISIDENRIKKYMIIVITKKLGKTQSVNDLFIENIRIEIIFQLS